MHKAWFRSSADTSRGSGSARIAALVALLIGLAAGALWWSRTMQAADVVPQALPPGAKASGLPIEGKAPPLDGAVAWLNSPPLGGDALRGKVVLVDFWTYTCINCLRALPHVKAWAEHYRDQGLVVVGVHTPEFDFEKELANVRRAVTDLGITYPVAVDSRYRIWNAFDNHYWPAHYFIDAQGRIRHHHFGEGDYAGSERIIRALLAEAGQRVDALPMSHADGSGAQLAPDMAQIGSPETYLGHARAEHFASPGGFFPDHAKTYRLPESLALNRWALAGSWTVSEQSAKLDAAEGSIVFRFRARDLNLVLGPGRDGKPVRFTVTLDGQPPAGNHGTDTDAGGHGSVTSQRLYQLIRSRDSVRERNFEIRFEDPGVEAFAFTFG
ncbi:thioredoxin family protein [Dokdonella sp.]|uniref:thioredoxin family protein n=1 Tax=Dokdonella sp. TaxID=2291710 RepID=UPI0025BE94E1|nr:thioredoxin family protein [Dokdonella sp.]MBX3688179.1 thioredoxin family protein [Dokdonella sp.]